MPQETKTAAEPTERTSLQGIVATRDDEQALLKALEQAFDYRGDVTITVASNDEITGYIFDRRTGSTLADSTVRVLTAQDDNPRVIRFADIAGLTFSGKDAAHGRSFDTWVKKYVEKKLAGEVASIESEKLD